MPEYKEPTPLTLTDTEWMNLIDQERDALQYCCANVSAVRDQVMTLARNPKYPNTFAVEWFKRSMVAYLDGHEYVSPELAKLTTQLGLDIEELKRLGVEIHRSRAEARHELV